MAPPSLDILPINPCSGIALSVMTGPQVRLRFIFFFKTLEPSGVHSSYSVGARGTFPRGKLGGVGNWPLMTCLSSSSGNIRMCEDIPPLLPLHSCPGQGQHVVQGGPRKSSPGP